mgnify:CR=1 FL=1
MRLVHRPRRGENAVDGDVTDRIQVTGEVDTTRPGAYALTYIATDTTGNQAMVTRVVTVEGVKAPVNTVRPKVSGAMRVGSVLRADIGTWTDADSTEFTAQWLRDGEPIRGALGGDYRLTAAGQEALERVREKAVELLDEIREDTSPSRPD